MLKIEDPSTGGDVGRYVPPFQQGDSSLYFESLNRNKKSVTLDMKSEQGKEVLWRLIDKGDILVENFRPGRMQQWGLDYPTLSKKNKGLVMLHISGYGQSGPYARRPGMGTLAEAFSGFAFITGEKDGPPTLPSVPISPGP